MAKSNIIVLVISGAVGLLLIGISIAFLSGKASSLLAGYNTMPEDERDRYDEVALGRFVGKIFLPIGILCPGVPVAEMFHISWYKFAFVALALGLIIFAVIYCNTADRFKKK